jgi:hypothetical protein
LGEGDVRPLFIYESDFEFQPSIDLKVITDLATCHTQ